MDHIRSALDDYRPQLIPHHEDMKTAAVAAVVRDGAEGAEMLFIRRAENEHDPWSGQMAFPGGRQDPGDPSPLAAAIRETREELDLDLERGGVCLGRLSDVAAVSRGRPLSLVIIPFVFRIQGEPAFDPNHEVAGSCGFRWTISPTMTIDRPSTGSWAASRFLCPVTGTTTE